MGSIVFLVIIGAAAGFIATRIMRIETDLITTIAIGIAGAVIGGLVLRTLLAVLGMMAGLIGAILGALLLIFLWQKLRNR
ncbi:GlsB/YeaQ/YmgE family stress response membrane protein [Phaeobacter sp. B1627]|uniref:GlsB/YeaQ/YmgE family stress response membrane protein n=1 Tax=Phaeobacter sp. B1627 TaxID=2583809 RepID=UPI00111BA63D|nr:GlsB/YeaQ/YmgE family stress response membrane protein [Phaeobacter sp. B1627]TNJ41148.1 GlsB/YeaQ/YmgE family stress response membrane protein [Phaeobacter sp. B1627]